MEGKKRGRPRVDTSPVNLRLPDEMIALLDERRKLEADLPTRPEMIRRALVQWLELTDPR
ncbi:ribbon-helix-helix protein, CopG family [Falsirhodobacter halotolerans]|uniref:ribbon-helix-helix protein, CopG family n=1 Tax=Falsirhodobacter halotolerans TaxID=1146892 RepID=UPI002454C5D3|nr:ribbon-helix-helix protein, CopG family [Falsirhodobacter halotolerans]